jgi:hypothetical protein
VAKSYRQLLLDEKVHERLLAVRSRISELFFNVEGTLGMGNVIGILMDHLEHSPPDVGWLRQKVLEAPRRGRPRRSKPDSRFPT